MYNISAEWKYINNFPNYLISNNGSVFSLYKNKIMKHRIDKDGYRYVGLNNETTKGSNKKVHRLVCEHFGVWNSTLSVDHINKNIDDNTIGNLRIATQTQQNYNTNVRSHNKLGVKGNFKIGEKYGAQININGKTTNLGRFKTLEEASEAYKTKARELHGEFFRE